MPLLDRLQRLLYEFYDLGLFDETAPFIISMMKAVEKNERRLAGLATAAIQGEAK